jgi:hypothetical protein
MGVIGVLGDAELGAQLRHARVFRCDRRLLLGAGPEGKRRPFRNLNHRPIALTAQFRQLRLEFAIELLRRVVAVQRHGGILRRRDIRQHFRRIGRMVRIENIATDLRPVHPAALRLTRIVQYAGGQFQLGIRQRVR